MGRRDLELHRPFRSDLPGLEALREVHRAEERDTRLERLDPVREWVVVRALGCDLDPPLERVRVVAGETQGTGPHERELWVGLGLGPRERVEPPQERCDLPRGPVLTRVQRDEVARAPDVATRDRVRDRRPDVALSLEPDGRARVQPRHGVRVDEGELALEHAREELVVAVDPARLVHRDEEEVRVLDLREHRRGPRGFEHPVAELGRERVQDRRAQHELAHHRLHRVEHVAREEVEDVARVARERVYEGARVRLLTECDRGEVEASGPSLGPAREAVHVPTLELHT